MSMHLMGHAFSTTRTSRPKKKLSDSQLEKMAKELDGYNKQMKKYAIKPKTLAEYIQYRRGKYKPELKGAVKSPLEAETYRRESPTVPSFGDQVGSIPGKPEKIYTGTLIKGIATMHKSNAVPVIDQKQMEEISRMRRG